MYYILIELFNVELLADSKFSAGNYSQFTQELTCHIKISQLQFLERAGDTSLYTLSVSSAGALRNAVHAIAELHRFLLDAGDYLHGFVLYIDKHINNEASVNKNNYILNEMSSYVTATLESNCLIVGAAAWRDMRLYIKRPSTVNGHAIIANPATEERLPALNYINLTAHAPCTTAIKKILTKHAPNKQLIIFKHARRECALSNIFLAVRDVVPPPLNDHLLIIHATRHENFLADCAHSLSTAIIEHCLQHLSSIDQSRALRLSDCCVDAIIDSNTLLYNESIRCRAQQFFRYIVRGYINWTYSLNAPTIIIIRDGSFLTQDAWDFLWTLCAAHKQKQRAHILLTCDTVPKFVHNLDIKPHYFDCENKAYADMRKHVPVELDKKIVDEFFQKNYGDPTTLHYGLLASLLTGKVTKTGVGTAAILHRHCARIVHALAYHDYVLLSIVALLGRAYSQKILWDFLRSIHYPLGNVAGQLRAMTNIGLLKNNNRCELEHENMTGIIRKYMRDKNRALSDMVAHYCYQQWVAGHAPTSITLLNILMESAYIDKSLEIFFELVYQCILDGQSSSVERLLSIYGTQLQSIMSDTSYTTELQCILACATLYIAMRRNDRKRAHEIINSESKEKRGNNFYGYFLIAHGRYLYYSGNAERAINYITQAIIIFQEHGNNVGIGRAYTDSGAYLLSTCKIREAHSHLRIAREIFDTINKPEYRVRSVALLASAHFAAGNYSIISELSGQLTRMREDDQWTLYAQFLKARARFELGDYQASRNEFQRGLRIAKMFEYIYAQSLYRAWIARADIYLDHHSMALHRLHSLPSTRETILFTTEAYILRGDYHQAAERLRDAIDNPPQQRIALYDRPDWRDGFIGCGEQHGVVLERLIHAFNGYLMAKEGCSDDAKKIFSTLIQLENISIYDPYLPIYHLLFCEILDTKIASELKFQQLLVGRALKCMQERAHRITDTEDRFSYVKRNYWNRRLVTRAHTYHLL